MGGGGAPSGATGAGPPRRDDQRGRPAAGAPLDAALVNAIATATEAKAQALFELGIAGTGTATDAVCIATPADGRAETFGGPRSRWGSRLARAVRDAVRLGASG